MAATFLSVAALKWLEKLKSTGALEESMQFCCLHNEQITLKDERGVRDELVCKEHFEGLMASWECVHVPLGLKDDATTLVTVDIL